MLFFDVDGPMRFNYHSLLFTPAVHREKEKGREQSVRYSNKSEVV